MRPTCELRFIMRDTKDLIPGTAFYRKERILQQWWEGDNLALSQWRDVPLKAAESETEVQK